MLWENGSEWKQIGPMVKDWREVRVLRLAASHLFSSSSALHPLAVVPPAGLWQSESEKFQIQKSVYRIWRKYIKPKLNENAGGKMKTYIFLSDMRRQSPEHYSLALLLLTRLPPVVLLWVVTVRVITIF